MVTNTPTITQEPIVTTEPEVTATEEPVVVPTDSVVEATDDSSYVKNDEVIDQPEVEKDAVVEADNKNDFSNTRPESDVTNSSKDKESNKGFTLFDSSTPLGFLPKTGTVSEVVFYVIGALLIVVAVVMVVVTIRKKRK